MPDDDGLQTASLQHLRSAAGPGSFADTLAGQLTAAGRGDAVAFTQLYDALVPRIYGLVVRVLRDEHQAEEVTQEVLLQIWQDADRFDPQRGSALSWVMMLAHRRAVDRVRSSAASRRRDHSDFRRSPQMPRDVTIESVETAHDGQLVRAGLATLSSPQREAVELAYFGGYTHTEISRLMQTPVGTAKTRIRQGLIRLRAALDSSLCDPA